MKVLVFACLLGLIACSAAAFDHAQWMPPARDMVGTGSIARANGINDWHIRISSGRLAGQTPAEWRIRGGLWYSMVDVGFWWAPYVSGWAWPGTLINVVQSGSQFDLYFDPLLAWPGDIFEVTAVISLEKTYTWKVLSNGESWLPGARWLGQGKFDRLGPAERAGDGVRDWVIAIEHPFLRESVARVDVWLPYPPMGNRIRRAGCFDHWSTHGGAAPVHYDLASGSISISINPVLACGGDEFIVRIVRPDGSFGHWTVVGLGSEWETGGEWFGQSEYDLVGMNENKPNGVRDWHLRVASPKLSSPVRWMVRGAKTTWESVAPGQKAFDPSARRMLARAGGDGMDIFMEPTTERAGDTFYVSAVLADGSMINWGVISLQQLRSDAVQWLGQVSERLSDSVAGGVTNALQPWCITVQHEKLLGGEPYRWSVARAGQKWQTPRQTDDELAQMLPLDVEQKAATARLYLDPEFARPGTRYEVEALFPDGTLVQWTALADGAEWARAALWLDDAQEDRVGHTAPAAPDRVNDWVFRITDDTLRRPLASLEVSGSGWRWLWPDARGISPVHVVPSGDSMTVHVAAVPGRAKAEGVLTVKALYQDGTVRYWQALPPVAP